MIIIKHVSVTKLGIKNEQKNLTFYQILLLLAMISKIKLFK